MKIAPNKTIHYISRFPLFALDILALLGVLRTRANEIGIAMSLEKTASKMRHEYFRLVGRYRDVFAVADPDLLVRRDWWGKRNSSHG